MLGKEKNKSILAIKGSRQVKEISDFVVEKAASLGLEKEIKYIKEIGENPEKMVDDIQTSVSEAILDPSTIAEKLKQKKNEIVFLLMNIRGN